MSLPTAATLPYTYRSVPSTLPVSAILNTNPDDKTPFVISKGGHKAHPDEIIAACVTLEQHVQKTLGDDATVIRAWNDSLHQRDLAEKRRVAPGWLDREEKLLQPTHKSAAMEEGLGSSLLDQGSADPKVNDPVPAIVPRDEGEELDRAFGGLAMK